MNEVLKLEHIQKYYGSKCNVRKPFYSNLPVTTNSMWWTSILTMDGLVRILTDQHFSE